MKNTKIRSKNLEMLNYKLHNSELEYTKFYVSQYIKIQEN